MATVKYPEPLIFGLDIGTRSIVGTVGYREQERFHVVAMAVKYHDTRSMIDGQIHDIAKVSQDIVEVKQQLEKQLGGRKLHDVCIAAAGRVLKTAIGHGEYEFSENTVITQEYIHSIDLIGVEQAHNEILQELNESHETTKYFCVGYTVVKYFLNNYEITNLEGHKGTKIAADVLATFLPEEVVDSLYAAVEQAGLYVTNLTLEPIAAMTVAIPEQYRLLNIALIDIGAGTSDICITKDGSVIAYGMIPAAGDELTEGSVNPHDILKIKGVRAVQDYMIREVQRVYRLQGVEINDKHIEVIVRQMLKKIRIEESGDTEFLPGTNVDRLEFEDVNEALEAEGKEPATGEQIIMGITKASLATNSFLSAASFQETTKVLTEAAIKGKVDPLVGLKENVIIGKHIPAGTGMRKYRDIKLNTEMEMEDELDFEDDFDFEFGDAEEVKQEGASDEETVTATSEDEE